jgi:adenine-specific DNA-methyltransferase
VSRGGPPGPPLTPTPLTPTPVTPSHPTPPPLGPDAAVFIADEATLIAAAAALADGQPLSLPERALLRRAPRIAAADIVALRAAVAAGGDPLGDAFRRLRPPAQRRAWGQVFTPWTIVDHMADLAAAAGDFSRIIDCGMGSGRYLRACARRFPAARLVGVEVDPLCALIARATLAADGLADRCDVLPGDFREIALPAAAGPCLFIGNPPYVRHHDIGEKWKTWYAASVLSHGLPRPSKLAGLHLHFFARVAELAQAGDLGVFVTAAEWLDTGYGTALRRLLLGPLGGRSVTTVAASAQPFPDAMTTAAVTVFAPFQASDGLTIGETDDPATLADAPGAHYPADDPALLLGRWSLLTRGRPAPAPPPKGHVGDLFRVSRGQVTGCNAAFVVGPDTPPLPARFLALCVTGAEQIFAAAERAGGRLTAAGPLGRVVSLPKKIDDLPAAETRQVRRFLDWARALGAESSYTAQHRSPWWRVATGEPAPILMSYMARRPPAFVRNDAGAAIINVAHGLRPKTPMTAQELDAAARALNAAVASAVGRIYAGGLVKFEPRAVEQIPIDWAAAGLGRALDAVRGDESSKG